MPFEEQTRRAAEARKAYEADPSPENERERDEAYEALKNRGKRPQKVALLPLADRTEEGAAAFFVTLYSGVVRYVPKVGWLLWSGSYWERDEVGNVYRLVRDMTHRLKLQLDAMPSKEPEQKEGRRQFARFVARMRSARAHDAILRIASRGSDIAVSRDELDRRPTLLPCLNGTVDLTNGELRAADRNDMLSRVVCIEYDPEAKAPKFQKFLAEIQPDLRMRLFLQRLLGYGLFGFVREHVFPIFYGDGANGKSVLAQVVQGIVGEYAQTVPKTLIVETRNEQHKTQIARLHRVRMGFVHETDRDARMNTEAVKNLTGGDVLTGHFMRKDFFDFVPTHTLYLLSNWKPQVDADMRAIWRRLLLIPFDVEIPPERQDLALADKIIAEESPGVLRWLVEGAAWWWTFSHKRDGGSGLLPPQRVIDETKEYQSQEDVIGRFVDECCEFGEHCKVQAGKLYTAYKDFCQREGIEKPATSNKFADAVRRVKNPKTGQRIGKSLKDSTDGRMYYGGIGLPGSSDDSADWID